MSLYNVKVTLGVNDKGDREVNDFYATDPIAVEWLLKIEPLSKCIWECACGQGHIAKVLADAGHTVKSTDLINRGFGVGGGRLLTRN